MSLTSPQPIKTLPRNASLNAAKRNPNDEWYTREQPVAAELSHHIDSLRDRTILCCANDGPASAFIRVLRTLPVAEVIGVEYRPLTGHGRVSVYTPGAAEPSVRELPDDGGFSSASVRELMRATPSPIIITNPPFSRFREFLSVVEEAGVPFLLLGTQNMTAYADVLPRLMDGTYRIGYTGNEMRFTVPDTDPPRATRWGHDALGTWRSLGNTCWLTNLPVRDKEFLPLTETYTPAAYPTYDDGSAIEVGRVVKIPKDYAGKMGVPITFLPRWNPNQFDLLGTASPSIGGKRLYKRLLIQRREAKEEETNNAN